MPRRRATGLTAQERRVRDVQRGRRVSGSSGGGVSGVGGGSGKDKSRR